MLDFKKAELDDLPLLRTYFAQANGRLCDETPGVFFMWRNHYAGSYAIRDGQLFLRYEAELGTEDTAFAILSGAPVEPGIRAIREHCRYYGTGIYQRVCVRDFRPRGSVFRQE